jgi:PTS system mannose-specific IID component
MSRAPAQDGPTAAGRDGAVRLGRGVLWRVFWRSLFLQAAWNPRGMQNVGFAWALLPALERLYPGGEALTRATERHLSCFNTHPYAAAAILGGAIHHEARIARGEEPAERVVAFKSALMGPLAAVGDGFFWLSLRPALGALSTLVALLLGLWGVVLYLIGYNAIHLAMRARLFLAGLRQGDRVVEAVAASRLPYFGARLRLVAAACTGAAAGLFFFAFPGDFAAGPWGPVVGAGVFLGCHRLLAAGASAYALAYGVAALALFSRLVF